MSTLGAVSAPVPGDVVADKYRVEKVLGEGGMGIVFLATHQITGKRVALKWLRPGLVDNSNAAQRLIREAQASAIIQHPNVVDVQDIGTHKGSYYLVMEHLYGEALSERIRRGFLEPDGAVVLLMPALRGIAAAHRRGVVHRDLKPENIFLCRGPDGEPREAKVLDLGISKLVAPDGNLLSTLTKSGTLIGTPAYMSPEQASDPKHVDSRSDVYALGVILFEMLTGTLPYRETRLSALLLEISQGAPIKLREMCPHLPATLEAVASRAMMRDPAERYPDVESFARALESFAPGTTFHRDPTGGHLLPRAATEPETDPMLDATLSIQRAGSTSSVDIPMRPRWPALAIVLFMLAAVFAWWLWPANDDAASPLPPPPSHSRRE